jgi:hypothetical protein
MKVVRNKSPSKTGGLGFPKNHPQPFKKLIPVGIIPEYLPPFNPSDHNVVQGTGCINPRFSWHTLLLLLIPPSCQDHI